MGRRRGPAVVAAIWAMWALGSLRHGAGEFMPNPLQGQGAPPREPVDVYFSVVLDRLLNVDEQNYRWEAMLYVYMSWEDPRALDTVANRTAEVRAGGECALACQSEYTSLFNPVFQCCDSLWRPGFMMTNLYELSESMVLRYGMVTTDLGVVGWWTTLKAVFYSPMDFRQFPRDEQELLAEFRVANLAASGVRSVIPSLTSTEFFTQGPGDVAAGWSVNSIRMDAFREAPGNYIRGSSVDGEPFPLKANDLWPDGGFTDSLMNAGVTVHVLVSRFGVYSGITIVLPIMLVTALSFVVYFVSAHLLETRLTISVTLVLTITALQFVIAAGMPASSYVTGVQKLMVLSYTTIFIGVPESLFTYSLAKWREEHGAGTPKASAKDLGAKDLGASGNGAGGASRDPQSALRLVALGALSAGRLRMQSERSLKRLARIVDRLFCAALLTVYVVIATLIMTNVI